MARLVPGGVTLRAQVDARWPNRDTASDGWIADAAHAVGSFHQPDAQGWVHALDVDEDLGAGPAGPAAMRRLADQLAACARDGRDGGRILHLVYEDQVASATAGDWAWRGHGYGHFHHLHVSFTDAAERDGTPFPLPILSPPHITPRKADPDMILLSNDGDRRLAFVSGDALVILTSMDSANALTAAGLETARLSRRDFEAVVARMGVEA